MKHVMLVVKLHHDTDNKRTEQRFREEMENEGWNPVQNISNTYYYSFSEDDDVPSAVRKSVRDATGEIGATDWDAIYGVSSEEPDRIKQG